MAEETDHGGFLEIEVSEVGGRSILAPAGAITFENASTLRDGVERLNLDRKGDVVIDFERVPLVDSEALETLLRLHESLAQKGCALKVIKLNDVCKDILVVTRLVNLFNVYTDLHAAVQSKVAT